MPFDEEEIDEHDGCRHEIESLRDQLKRANAPCGAGCGEHHWVCSPCVHEPVVRELKQVESTPVYEIGWMDGASECEKTLDKMIGRFAKMHHISGVEEAFELAKQACYATSIEKPDGSRRIFAESIEAENAAMRDGMRGAELPLIDIMYRGLGCEDDYTLSQVVAEFQRRVIEDTTKTHPSMVSAARSLGVTRECLWKLRRRHHLPVADQTKPIPDDWREKLEA